MPVRFDDEFVRWNPHASAIRTAGKMDSLVAYHFVLSSMKAIDRLSISTEKLLSAYAPDDTGS